jgi:hypothetical protein
VEIRSAEISDAQATTILLANYSPASPKNYLFSSKHQDFTKPKRRVLRSVSHSELPSEDRFDLGISGASGQQRALRL